MVDDELLQELLSKGSALYNNGDYRGAIGVWKEALQVDPSSRRAREGIQMATLLLGDWEPPETECAPGPSPSPSGPAELADGGAAGGTEPDPADLQKTLDEGIADVRSLLSRRQYPEALEGARGLVPIDPDSEEVRLLLEEAQQAFEAAPFIGEHLTLARELLSQERRDEAAAECRKIFALDPDNPDAQSLLNQIGPPSPQPPPSDPELSGQTMKMSLDEIAEQVAQQVAGKTSGGAPVPPNSGQKPLGQEGAGEDVVQEDVDLAMNEPSGSPPPHGPQETSGGEPPVEDPQPEVGATAAGAGPPREVTRPGHELKVGQEASAGATRPGHELNVNPGGEGKVGVPAEPLFDLEDDGTGAPGEPKEAPEVVEAVTVVPPSVREVPRSPEATGGPSSKEPSQNEEAAPPAPDPTPPEVSPPASKQGAREEDAAAWEIELTQLNLREGERDILGHAASNAGSAVGGETAVQAEEDLLAVLDDDMGAAPEAASQETGDSIQLADRIPPAASTSKPEAAEKRAPDPGSRSAPAPGKVAPRSKRPRPTVVSPESRAPEGRSSVPKYFALLGFVILIVAAAGWWFFFQPGDAAGAGAPAHSSAPPASNASGPPAPGAQTGPIPTPIGGPGHRPPQRSDDAPGDAGVENVGEAGDSAVTGETSQDEAPVAPPPVAPRRRSPEEVAREVEQHLRSGEKLLAAERWTEALDELQGAIALDPGNMVAKQMVDRAKAGLDLRRKRDRDFNETLKLFEDKDYQNALWKLYRLPRDQVSGDLDLYIRNAWYNWAVIAMRAGDATDALQKIAEVMAVDPNDPDAPKLQQVAEAYSARAKDRQFFAFAARLKLRKMDQK